MSSQAEGHSLHISQQFNVELEEVKGHMMEMGGVVEKQLADALESVVTSNSNLGLKVSRDDDEIDSLEMQIDEECSLIIARRQPAASDLRLVLAIIKTIRDLERIGDESSKIAKMAVKLSEEGEIPSLFVEFKNIGAKVQRMVSMSLNAFARFDAEAALEITKADLEVDMEYRSAMSSMITYMTEDPRSITRVLNILWALRALERIGDHAKNIAEHVVYLVQGKDVRHEKLE
ncbi:MAG TPA: phosphate transport system regulatory protein PhoU [Gammaproteobacteria bacterium]|nr:phosphate transport system regulatory protein PhoU [Gammaproteobacteria bacterium]